MNFTPTDAPAGSPEKLEILRRRYEHGLPLFHPCDRQDYSGLSGNQIITQKNRKAARPGKQIIKLMLGGRKMRAE